MLVEAKRYGQGDPDRSITYLCSDFPWMRFTNNQFYDITYKDGKIVRFKCTRGRTTLYSGRIPDNIEIEVVPKGPNPPKVFHEIESLSQIDKLG